ncbi:Hypothetical predicted protein [Pelobates cultripes]|uniref:Uncharacterized protein n=1 Tax=Pelobates cultripes TaxID=61616 RepID=A0AAD1RR95_PELCU|nr:Hypothetical predicted protein [Pelobates cultripes]
MGRNRKVQTPVESGVDSPRETTGHMDDYLATPNGLQDTRHADKMAAASPSSDSVGEIMSGLVKEDTLTLFSADSASISANVLTHEDWKAMVAELHSVIWEKIMQFRFDLTALESRVEDLETDCQQLTHCQQSAELTISRQGFMLLEFHRQVKDLDNQGWLTNICFRGLPETEGEPLMEVLKCLFTQILGDDTPANFKLERTHRVFRPPRWDGLPQDIICCFRSFRLKDAIIQVTQPLQSTHIWMRRSHSTRTCQSLLLKPEKH